MCCRKGGTVSVPGVYIGFPDKIPFGALMNKGPDDSRWARRTCSDTPNRCCEKIESRGDRPIVRHHAPAANSATVRRRTRPSATRRIGCIKVVLKP